MRVLVEAVVLDFPDAVEPKLVREYRLLEAVVEQARLGCGFRVGNLHFEEEGEFHGMRQASAHAARVRVFLSVDTAPRATTVPRAIAVDSSKNQDRGGN